MSKSRKNTVLETLALFLPGIFLLGFNIGTGSVTAMAAAGATYGMSLLWTIAASCVATYFMIVIYGNLRSSPVIRRCRRFANTFTLQLESSLSSRSLPQSAEA